MSMPVILVSRTIRHLPSSAIPQRERVNMLHEVMVALIRQKSLQAIDEAAYVRVG